MAKNQQHAASCFDAACTRCPRLAAFLRTVRGEHPNYHCAPVPAFGAADPQLLIVGLAPGKHGANRTGRPFTGDYAGVLLYQTLYDAGLATQATSLAAGDPLRLRGTRITNAVKCLPPDNKPTPAEARTCNAYLAAELASLSSVRAVLALGRVAHEAVLRALDEPVSRHTFAHGAEHELARGRWLVDSYHCSRYNTQTRRLTPAMFAAAVRAAVKKAGLSDTRAA
jgi:uracil-DNA glycosylase family 4